MKIAIHSSRGSFSERWIAYCKENQIYYKIVDCYNSDIIRQLDDCDGLMWHFHQADPKAVLFAKQLLYSMQLSGKKVFPDFNTVWHFDDKVGQKYLLESIGAPLVPSYVFYTKNEALEWAKTAHFPKVFKLRRGAGAANVRLVGSEKEAKRQISKAFGRGFRFYDPWGGLKERWRKLKNGETIFFDLIKGIGRIFIRTGFEKVQGKEKGYVYYQEFIPGNDHYIRVIVIGKKAFAIKRLVRKNDFRASGSGTILYEKGLYDEDIIRLSFELSLKLKSQCVAFDYIYDNKEALLTEISYGFSPEGYDLCPGYWDNNMRWNEGEFNPYGWMVENLIAGLK